MKKRSTQRTKSVNNYKKNVSNPSEPKDRSTVFVNQKTIHQTFDENYSWVTYGWYSGNQNFSKLIMANIGEKDEIWNGQSHLCTRFGDKTIFSQDLPQKWHLVRKMKVSLKGSELEDE